MSLQTKRGSARSSSVSELCGRGGASHRPSLLLTQLTARQQAPAQLMARQPPEPRGVHYLNEWS